MDLHHVRIAGGAEQFGTTVELDGRPVLATKVEFTATVGQPYAEVTITLPAVVEVEGSMLVKLNGKLLMMVDQGKMPGVSGGGGGG